MLNITARIVKINGSDGELPAYRVDLDYQLTAWRPYTRSYLRYLSDDITEVDYGLMLSQQLRRIPGVDSVEITHYGCLVKVGRLFVSVEMGDAIMACFQLVLESAVPWAVCRDSDGSNWCYHLASAPLSQPGTCVDLHDRRTFNAFTDLGRIFSSDFSFADVEPWKIHTPKSGSSRIWLPEPKVADPGAWVRLDKEFDALMMRLVGTRKVKINWNTMAS